MKKEIEIQRIRKRYLKEIVLSKQKMACDGRNCDVDFKYL